MLISRRALLLGAFAGVAVAAVAALGVGSTTADLVARIIKRRLPYIRIDAADLDEFCQAMAQDIVDKTRVRQAEAKLTALRTAYNVVDASWLRPIVPQSIARDIAKLEDRIITRFLLSTDFFEQDTSAPRIAVSYLYFADPYQAPCSNRLAQFGT